MKRAASSPANLHNKCKCAGELAALFTWSEKVSNGSDKGDVEQKILTFSLTLLSDTAI